MLRRLSSLREASGVPIRRSLSLRFDRGIELDPAFLPSERSYAFRSLSIAPEFFLFKEKNRLTPELPPSPLSLAFAVDLDFLCFDSMASMTTMALAAGLGVCSSGEGLEILWLLWLLPDCTDGRASPVSPMTDGC